MFAAAKRPFETKRDALLLGRLCFRLGRLLGDSRRGRSGRRGRRRRLGLPTGLERLSAEHSLRKLLVLVRVEDRLSVGPRLGAAGGALVRIGVLAVNDG